MIAPSQIRSGASQLNDSCAYSRTPRRPCVPRTNKLWLGAKDVKEWSSCTYSNRSGLWLGTRLQIISIAKKCINISPLDSLNMKLNWKNESEVEVQSSDSD